MNTIVLQSQKAKKAMVRYDPAPPRCSSCEHQTFNNSTSSVQSWCNNFAFPVKAMGLCDFWESQATGEGLAS